MRINHHRLSASLPSCLEAAARKLARSAALTAPLRVKEGRRRNVSTLRIVTLTAASLNALVLGQKAQAQNYDWTWTGAGGNYSFGRDWTYAANWDSGVPANDGTASLSFGTLGNGLDSSPYLAANWNIFSLDVYGNTSYVFGSDYYSNPYGVSLATAQIIDVSSTASQEFVMPVTFTNSGNTLTNYSSGVLQFGMHPVFETAG